MILIILYGIVALAFWPFMSRTLYDIAMEGSLNREAEPALMFCMAFFGIFLALAWPLMLIIILGIKWIFKGYFE